MISAVPRISCLKSSIDDGGTDTGDKEVKDVCIGNSTIRIKKDTYYLFV